MPFVCVEKQGHIGIMTLSREEALNALNTQMLGDLSDAIDQVSNDSDIYVAVLTGQGRAFAAGADIGEMRDFTSAEGQQFSSYGGEIYLKLENMIKPIIAAVNGVALGGGCELAMACDIRFASEKAKFGQPEVGLGITPGFGGTMRLARIVGQAKALEMILSGKTIAAGEAKTIGLVNEVYPPEELMEKALEFAGKICENAQIAVRQAKRCIRMGMQTDIYTAMALESEAFGVCCGTEDHTEGMSAFLDNRAEKHFENR